GELPQLDSPDRRLDAELTGSRARGVRAVAVAVTRGQVVVLEVEPGRCRARREVLGADQLGRVVVLVPVLALDDGAAELRAVGLVEVDVGPVAVRLAPVLLRLLLLLQLLAV